MPNRSWLVGCLGAALACGGGAVSSDPGPLVDNTQWEWSEQGQSLFGAQPPDSQCLRTPMDCDEYYPWPEGECVPNLAGSSCIASYVPECYDTYTVLSVYTRMPDERVPRCNWLTLEQASLRDIRAGDRVEVRTFHFALTAPFDGEARMSLAIGDELAFDQTVLIPANSGPLNAIWVATRDYPAGTPVLWHVNNHGSNEYLLIEVNVLE